MGNFKFENTPLKDLFVGSILSKADERGYFERVFCLDEIGTALGRYYNIKQINRSMSKITGTTRGLHFQFPPFSETKIVSCPSGKLFDVAVDIRSDSPTFMRYFSRVLSSSNKDFLVIPEGFAHGFQTLVPNTEILYLVTKEFSPPHDNGLNPLDPSLSIDWPLPISIMSPKDTNRPFIDSRDFTGIDSHKIITL
jgi:dTDP-4-dehydrorhamnose 3,5-epimerase